MYTLLIIVHVICSVLLVSIVLLQVGRGRGMMGFLGSSTAESLFGSRAGDVLTKSTTVIAALFMVTSLSLAYISLNRTGSITRGIKSKSGLTPGGASVPVTAAGGEDKLAEKGALLVQKTKEKLLKKIPRLGIKKGGEPVPSATTKSKIRYDEKGNKIVEEYKYDSAGKLTGHREVTHDRLDKVIGEKELPLVEEGTAVETKS